MRMNSSTRYTHQPPRVLIFPNLHRSPGMACLVLTPWGGAGSSPHLHQLPCGSVYSALDAVRPHTGCTVLIGWSMWLCGPTCLPFVLSGCSAQLRAHTAGKQLHGRARACPVHGCS
jgi:hypothetical protein